MDFEIILHSRFDVPTVLVDSCNLSVKRDNLREESVFLEEPVAVFVKEQKHSF